MEANNGYEYKVVKVRKWPGTGAKATERAIARAAQQGWELVHVFPVDGVVSASAVTLRRATEPSHPRASSGVLAS
ncbi:hypothetical protein BH24ACT26_BH24ACT26_11000 [soil metagenome]